MDPYLFNLKSHVSNKSNNFVASFLLVKCVTSGDLKNVLAKVFHLYCYFNALLDLSIP